MKLRIGTRGSRLALAQTNWVIDRLRAHRPDIECEVQIIHTTGDKILDKPLAEIGDKGLFVRQIEQALLDGEIDLAVHSMKDMPTAPVEGLCFSQVWPRADRRDALVLRQPGAVEDLPQGARLATGSKRRVGQLLQLRPDFVTEGIRGNLDTRLRKMEEQQLDGLVLAAAGLQRLGLGDRISRYFSDEEVLPAPAQGALALEVRSDNAELLTILNDLCDPKADREVRAERAFLAAVDGSCQIPVGASAHWEGNSLTLHALLGNAEADRLVRCTLVGSPEAPEKLGQRAADLLRAKLAKSKEEF